MHIIIKIIKIKKYIFCDQKRRVNANYTNTPMASSEGNWMTIQNNGLYWMNVFHPRQTIKC